MNWLHMNIKYLSIVLASLAVVALGIKGLVEKKPFMYSSRGFFDLFTLLIFGPELFRAVCDLMDGQRWQQPALDVIIGLSLIFLFLFLNRGVRGYVSPGTTSESLRGAILAALSARSLAYEEMPTKFYLKNEKVELAFGNSWFGGEVSITKGHEETLRAIVTEMKKYFRENKVSVNLSLFTAFLFFGILGLIKATYFSTSGHRF